MYFLFLLDLNCFFSISWGFCWSFFCPIFIMSGLQSTFETYFNGHLKNDVKMLLLLFSLWLQLHIDTKEYTDERTDTLAQPFVLGLNGAKNEIKSLKRKSIINKRIMEKTIKKQLGWKCAFSNKKQKQGFYIENFI